MPSNAPSVLVTQSAPNHESLCDKLQQAGIPSIAKACIDIEPIAISSIQAQALSDADCWVFLSTHAVYHASDIIHSCYQQQHVISIGPTTAHALANIQCHVHDIPLSYTSEGIHALPYFQEQPRKVVIFTGKNGPRTLQRKLKPFHTVHQCNTYRRRQTSIEAFTLTPTVREHLQAVTVHSKLSLQFLHNLLIANAYKDLLNKELVVVNETMRNMAKDMGFTRIHISKNPTADAIVQTLSDILTY